MVEMFRRTGLLVIALALAAGLAPVAAASATSGGASASAAAPYCGISWGSQPNTSPSDETPSQPGFRNIRAGRHACFDRLVFDFRGNVEAYNARYVTTVYRSMSGEVVPLRGGAKLLISFYATQRPAAGGIYQCTNCTELVNVAGYRTFRQASWAGNYRSSPNIGLGLRARLPFRVFQLPNRLVIDVAHRW